MIANSVIPAQAGIQGSQSIAQCAMSWIPACAGMTWSSTGITASPGLDPRPRAARAPPARG
jgi:hypothetical protein